MIAAAGSMAVGQPAAGRPYLDNGTNSSHVSRQGYQPGHIPAFRLITREWQNGTVERVGSFLQRSPDAWMFARPSARRSHAAIAEADEGRAERSIRRTRKTFRHLMLSLSPDRMLTLTYRENVQDYDRAARDLQVFIKWLRRHYPSIPFVAVAERQERGAWHWHIALRDWVNVVQVRAAWGHGAVNIKRKRVNVARGRAAAYMAKYLSKSVDMVGRAAYRVYNRKFIEKPIVRSVLLHLKNENDGLPMWARLTAAFSHLAASSFVKDGIFWRVDYVQQHQRTDEHLHSAGFEVRTCFGSDCAGA